MKQVFRQRTLICLLLLPMIVFSFAACSILQLGDSSDTDDSSGPDISKFIVAVEDEPDTVDFQCTSIHYTIAQNVFNRLVETENDANGDMQIQPSLAESWDISEDGRTYTFHLRENVKFSNGSPLTATDVEYTFKRLLTHPESCNKDIADGITGAGDLESGKTDRLAGFKVLGDLDFSITLDDPFAAFLACLSMPAASILDKETTQRAGERFGKYSDWTIGTGSYVIWKWIPDEGMMLTANKNCWQGAPRNEGLNLKFITDSKEIRRMFDKGEIDVLDLDEVGNAAEYYIHGDIYQDRLFVVPRIGITYIALNESIEPLDDVRVRTAMQEALNRSVLLKAVYGGRGSVENGIYPAGLYGHDPDLPEIPYDPEEAKKLLTEAGYPDGIDLTVSVNSVSTHWEMSVLRIATSMWEKVGIRTTIDVIDEGEFMDLRKSGRLECYTAQWMADYNDPDNFIYTFFGNWENTSFRSLCYSEENVMKRVRRARAIADPYERIKEYRDLQSIIVQDDAAWIPLYSRLRYYVTSERLEGIQASWNGSVKNKYRELSIADGE